MVPLETHIEFKLHLFLICLEAETARLIVYIGSNHDSLFRVSFVQIHHTTKSPAQIDHSGHGLARIHP